MDGYGLIEEWKQLSNGCFRESHCGFLSTAPYNERMQ